MYENYTSNSPFKLAIDIDIKKDDFTIDVKKAENLINKKTIAVIAVDLFGNPCDYKELLNLKKKYKIKNSFYGQN